MAFTRPAAGQVIQHTDITQIVEAWEGTSGGANRLQVTQVNDSSNYALDVQNLDGTNSYGVRVRDSASNVILTAALAAVTLAKKLVMTGLGTYTAAVNLLDIAATWNAAADTFNGIKVNVTNTASAAASTLFDFQVASTSVLKLTALKAITHALGTVTAAIDQLTLSATWNAGAAAFNGIIVSITNTASAATSRLIDLKVGGTSQFAVGPDGALYSPGAAGDTLYASSTTALAKLAIGTARKVLEVNAGATAPTWGPVRPVSGEYMGAASADRHVEGGSASIATGGFSDITFTNAYSSAPGIVLGATGGGGAYSLLTTTGVRITHSGAGTETVGWHAEGPD